MTITPNHPEDLLSQPMIGFAQVPGDTHVLNRATQELVLCTAEKCPYGTDDEVWGRINRAPYGANDMVVGSVSSLVPTKKQEAVKEFFQFVSSFRSTFTTRQQPLNRSELQASAVGGYADLIESLTEDPNGVIPVRIPGSFDFLSDLDTAVYEYLSSGNYSDTNKAAVRKKVVQSWERRIYNHDSQVNTIPVHIFYEKSLGVFEPREASHLYIGDTLRYVGWGLGGISCLASLYFALWVWKYQQENVVRASQPIFLWLLCLGTFIMSMCIFPFGIEDDIAPAVVNSS